MPKYISDTQLLGDAGESFVSFIVSNELKSIFRPVAKRDTGIDGEIELTEPVLGTSDRTATGIGIKVQIKTSRTHKFTNGSTSFSLSDDDIEYLTSNLNAPAVLIFCDFSSSPKAYWAQVAPASAKTTKTVRVDERNLLSSATLTDFAKITRYYEYLISCEQMFRLLERIKISVINKVREATSDNSLSYILNDFVESDLKAVCDTHTLLRVDLCHADAIPGFENILSRSVKFGIEANAIKNAINDELQSKFGRDLEYYLSDASPD